MKIAMERSGDILVGVQGSEMATHEEFKPVLAAYMEAFKATDYRIRFAMITDAGLDPTQRKKTTEAGWGRGTSRAVVISQGKLVRGVVTALSWVGVPVQSASPGNAEAVLRSALNMSDSELREVRAIAGRLREKITSDAPSLDEFLEHAARAAE